MEEELKEMTQNYLRVRTERDQYRAQISKYKSQIDQVKQIVAQEVKRALAKQSQEFESALAVSSDKIMKLEEHNACYKETIAYLENQTRELKARIASESLHRHEIELQKA